MAKCKFQTVCPYFRRRIASDDASYNTNKSQFCEGNAGKCAIYQVIEKASFLDVPGDLLPPHTNRVAEILEKKKGGGKKGLF